MALEESFVDQLRSGQPAAYAILVERFEGPLYRFFLCDHRNHHVAEEQTAETFAQLVRTLPGMRGGVNQLRAYVFGTARHVQLRRWRRPRESPLPLAEALSVRDPGQTPADLAEAREQADQVLGMIKSLDDPLGQILFLRFVEDCSIEEIAEAMVMPVGTVKSHISRGRARLKLIMADKECKP